MVAYDPRFLRLKTYDTQPGNLWVYDAKSANNTIEEVLSAGFFDGAFYQMRDGDVMIIIDVTEILFSPIRKTDTDIELDQSINLNYTASDIDFDDTNSPITGSTNVQQVVDWLKEHTAFLNEDVNFNSVTIDSVPTSSNDAVNLDYLNQALASRFLNLPDVNTIATTNINIASNLIGQTINGYTLVNQDKILLTAQTDAKQNLVYTVTSSGLVVVTECSTGKDLQSALVGVKNTTSTYKFQTWETFGSPLIVGTNNISWQQSNFGYNSTGAINLINNIFQLAQSAPLDNTFIAGIDSNGNFIYNTLQNNAITTAKIADNAVTTIKISDNAITTAKIADGNITNSKLIDNTIAYTRLANTTANTILGRSGSGGPIVSMSLATSKNMLGLPSTSTANNFAGFSNTSGTIVNTAYGPSNFNNKFIFLKLNTTQSTGLASGNPIKYDTIAQNNTSTITYDPVTGIISLGLNTCYEFIATVHPRFSSSSGFVEIGFALNGNPSNIMNLSSGIFSRPLNSSANEPTGNILRGRLNTFSTLIIVQVIIIAPSALQDFYGSGTTCVNTLEIKESPLS